MGNTVQGVKRGFTKNGCKREARWSQGDPREWVAEVSADLSKSLKGVSGKSLSQYM